MKKAVLTAAAVVLGAALALAIVPRLRGGGSPAPAHFVLHAGAEPLRAELDGDAGKVRLVILVAPS